MNDGKNTCFQGLCDHDHNMSCTRCKELKDVLSNIEDYLAQVEVVQNELDSIQFTCSHAIQDITSWKAHQLRSVRQDKARTDVLLDLDETFV